AWQPVSARVIHEMSAVITGDATASEPDCSIATATHAMDFVGGHAILGGEVDELASIVTRNPFMGGKPDRAGAVHVDGMNIVSSQPILLSKIDELPTVVARRAASRGKPQVAMGVDGQIMDLIVSESISKGKIPPGPFLQRRQIKIDTGHRLAEFSSDRFPLIVIDHLARRLAPHSILARPQVDHFVFSLFVG